MNARDTAFFLQDLKLGNSGVAFCCQGWKRVDANKFINDKLGLWGFRKSESVKKLKDTKIIESE